MMVMLCLWTLSSCNQEMIQDGGYGYLSICLDNDLSEDIVTKAGEERVFSIDVLDASGAVVKHIDDHRTVTAESPIELRVGTYTVVAKSGHNVNAAFENPYYEGHTEVKLHPTNQNVANITCKLANTRFSVEFPENFNKFREYEVSVTNGTGNALVFSNMPDSGNSLEAGLGANAYFAVTGTLTWTVTLVNTDGGKWTSKVTYSDVKAGQHYHLRFAMGANEAGDGAIVLNVKLEDWTDQPDHDFILDFTQNFGVTASDGFAVSGTAASVAQGDDSEKVLTFSASEGFKTIGMTHSNSTLASAGIPQSMEFVGATSEQLAALSAAGIVVTDDLTRSINTNTTNVYIDVTNLFAKLPVGSYAINFAMADNKGKTDTFSLLVDIVLDVDDAEAVQAKTGWAAFARLEGRINNEAKQNIVTFQYKKASDSQWIEMNPSEMEVSGQTYNAIVTGLEPSTEYVFRAVSDTDKDTRTVSFTTSSAATIPNLNFDSWYQNEKAWMPNENKNNHIWDTANPGTSGMGYVPTTPETNTVVSGKAARLETQLVDAVLLTKLAAGNIYTGKFGKVSGFGALLDWGIPFSSRPLALRGYWKYAPKTINKADGPYTDKKGDTDLCQVQIFLTDWSAPFQINTDKEQFVDFNSPAIIARGELHTDETHSGYVQFTIPLVYRDLRIPTYAVISGAASMYGDYFTGGVGSVLLLDEFELIYDPAELTEAEYNTVFSQVSPF